MRKFLLVVFIGMVLAMNLYGVINKMLMAFETEESNDMDEVVTVVYEE